ncbi:hypothetical protein CBL_03093 [Carabus blaptoides fortunei]
MAQHGSVISLAGVKSEAHITSKLNLLNFGCAPQFGTRPEGRGDSNGAHMQTRNQVYSIAVSSVLQIDASHPRYGWNQEYHAYVVSVFDAKYDASSNWNKIYVLAICFIRPGTCKQKALCKQLNSDSSCHPCHTHWNEVSMG